MAQIFPFTVCKNIDKKVYFYIIAEEPQLSRLFQNFT